MERKTRYNIIKGRKPLNNDRKKKKYTIKKRKVKGGALLLIEIYNHFIKPYTETKDSPAPATNPRKVVVDSPPQPVNPLEPKAPTPAPTANAAKEEVTESPTIVSNFRNFFKSFFVGS